jgi:XRE family transcriptional regulator of biofilm formation
MSFLVTPLPTSGTYDVFSGETTSSLATNLKTLRISKNLSQMELAEMTGLDRSYISKIERNVVKNVSLEVLTRISAKLGCTITELLGNAGEKASGKIHIDVMSEIIETFITEIKDSAAVLNETGYVLHYNNAFQKYIEYTDREIRFWNILRWLPIDSLVPKPQQYQCHIVSRSGRVKDTVITSKPLKDHYSNQYLFLIKLQNISH